MAPKRKRSFDGSPLSVSSFGTVATPEAQSPTPFPTGFNGSMGMDTGMGFTSITSSWNFMNASRVKDNDWGNRTRKRFRDGRPDEREIHVNTLNKLFAAQRQPPIASLAASHEQPSQPTESLPAKPQKSTLHSFWKQLPAPVARSTPNLAVQPHEQMLNQANLARCEDCDSALQNANESSPMDMDIDMDGGSFEDRPFACSDCGKQVCETCAVVSAKRHCLQCAIRGRNSRRWW